MVPVGSDVFRCAQLSRDCTPSIRNILNPANSDFRILMECDFFYSDTSLHQFIARRHSAISAEIKHLLCFCIVNGSDSLQSF